MNEESLSIIVNQKRDIENLHEYVDAGFKVICDWGRQDHKSIKILSFCFGVMVFALHRQNKRIKKLEMKVNELNDLNKQEHDEIMENNVPLEEAPTE